MGIASTDAATYVAWGDSRRGSVQLPVEDYYFASAVHDGEALASAGASGGNNTARHIALGSVVTLVVAGLVLLIAARGVGRGDHPDPERTATTVASG